MIFTGNIYIYIYRILQIFGTYSANIPYGFGAEKADTVTFFCLPLPLGRVRRDTLQRLYPTFERFDEAFEIDDATLRGLTELGAERGVAPDEAGFAVSAELLRVQLKALVAQRLFGTEGYYRVVNRLRSEAFREAVSLLKAWEQRGRPLLENRK